LSTRSRATSTLQQLALGQLAKHVVPQLKLGLSLIALRQRNERQALREIDDLSGSAVG
jgi:hypothetical protein